jgi:uncharacterized protein (TIGR03435 family)
VIRYVTILLTLALCLSHAQAPAFDAASIKPAAAEATERSLTHNPGGRLSTSNATVRMLILLAYQVMPYQISGGPSWFDSDGFDIEAKAANANSTPEQFRQMVQALLADRFHLKIHKETRELPIYALVVAKGGAKLMPAAGDESNSGVRNLGGEITSLRGTMPMLATTLTRPLQHKVVDETGLKGEYNFSVKFEPLNNNPPGMDAASEQPAAGSIFSALQEQLGLYLKVSKGPVEVLVIDSAAKPGAN